VVRFSQQRDRPVSEQNPINKEETTTIVCDEVLDIAIAADLREALLEALRGGQPVTLDGSAVERADTAALQVLAAFFQDARSRGIPVRWHSPSAALLQAATLLGMVDILAMETTQAA